MVGIGVSVRMIQRNGGEMQHKGFDKLIQTMITIIDKRIPIKWISTIFVESHKLNRI